MQTHQTHLLTLKNPKQPKPEITAPDGFTPSANAKSVTTAAEGNEIIKAATNKVLFIMTYTKTQKADYQNQLDKAEQKKVVDAWTTFEATNKDKDYEYQLMSKNVYIPKTYNVPNADSKNGTLEIKKNSASMYLSKKKWCC